MPAVAIAGDAATTTALAIASSWPVDHDVLLVEADRRGGSLAAWLDLPATPSLSTVVSSLRRAGSEAHETDRASVRSLHSPGGVVDSLVRRTPAGLRLIPCPIAAREAGRAVDEADGELFPSLVRSTSVVVFDLGRVDGTLLPATALVADVVVLVHRQSTSPRAGAVRLERFADLAVAVRSSHPAIVVAVIGDRPFGADEIVRHCGLDPTVDVMTLADDPMAAAVLAGAGGLSAGRLRRRPLLRSARRSAAALAGLVRPRDAGTEVASNPAGAAAAGERP